MRFLSWVLVCALTLPAAWAQNVAGTIVGTIKDATGGVIQGATVSVTNQDTNVEFRVETNDSGDYVAPNLAPGLYTVKGEFTGFRQGVVKDVRLLANRTVRNDMVLETGAITQAIEVQAAPPW